MAVILYKEIQTDMTCDPIRNSESDVLIHMIKFCKD